MTDDTADYPQDTRPPENMAEAAGLVSTDPVYTMFEDTAIESSVLLEFALALTGRFPSVVLRHIANIMHATITIEVPGSDTAQIKPGG